MWFIYSADTLTLNLNSSISHSLPLLLQRNVVLFCCFTWQDDQLKQHDATFKAILEKDGWSLSLSPRLSYINTLIQFATWSWLVFDNLGVTVAYPTTRPVLAWINTSPCTVLCLNTFSELIHILGERELNVLYSARWTLLRTRSFWRL